MVFKTAFFNSGFEITMAKRKTDEIAMSHDVLPLKDLVVFPNMVVPLIVGRESSLAAIESAVTAEKYLFLVTQKDALKDDVKARDLYRTGVVARILKLIRLPNGLVKVLVEGIYEAKVKRFAAGELSLKASIALLELDDISTNEEEARQRQLVDLFKKYIKLNANIPEDILFSFNQISDLQRIIDFIGTYLEIPVKVKQKVLEETSLARRIDFLIDTLGKENHILSIKSKLESKTREQMMKSQRHFYLQEQLRVIHDELEDDDAAGGDVAKLKKAIDFSGMPAPALEKAREELQRFERVPSLSPESGVLRTYIEWLTAVPWTAVSKDNEDIVKVRSILDEDHCGLDKPKQRIVEYIATIGRIKKMKGSILCLVGPPGVGKTSLGRSIARALNRKYVRVSLGGIHDEAEIRGHRRTYIGALPGKIIQSMKKAGTINPVFLLDEIDKLGADFRGDPAAALLEVLDPEQNNQFVDNYLETEYDLSRVLFVVTANSTMEIPEALLDRLEVIEMPGYHDLEKLRIAKDHLLPKALTAHGLSGRELKFGDDAFKKIITEYTAEAGVRGLEKEINKICRRTVVKLAESPGLKHRVTAKNIVEFLGERKYTVNTRVALGEVGVALGLAWTAYGGDVLPIEVNLLPGKDKVTMTGKLGEVMQESVQVAISFIRSRAQKYGVNANFVQKNEIHIHLPEGAVSKEGPSAGISLTSALLSALKKQKFPKYMAMTGEITLRGNVLEIGGLNEKLLAAKRSGIKKVILPVANQKDIREIDEKVYENIELIYADHYDDVYKQIFKR